VLIGLPLSDATVAQTAAAFTRGSRLVFEPQADHALEVEDPPVESSTAQDVADSDVKRLGVWWDQEHGRLAWHHWGGGKLAGFSITRAP
jgi:hypothetical protein